MDEFHDVDPDIRKMVMFSLQNAPEGQSHLGRRKLREAFPDMRATDCRKAARIANNYIKKTTVPATTRSEVTSQLTYSKDLAERLEQEVDPHELLDRMIGLQEELHKHDNDEDIVNANIDTDKPVMVVIRGDMHFGNFYTDHVRIRHDNELIKTRDYIFTMESGDMIDGAVFGGMTDLLHEQLVSPKYQRRITSGLIGELVDNILLMTAGQHDTWTHKTGDFNPVEWLCEDYQKPYIGFGGKVNLTVGDQLYDFVLRHNFRFNSSYNPEHSPKQLWRMGEHGFTDFAIVADKHTPVCDDVMINGKIRGVLRPGTYKKTDWFCKKQGYPKSLPMMPGIILWPDRRQWMGNVNFRKLIPVLDAMRNDMIDWQSYPNGEEMVAFPEDMGG